MSRPLPRPTPADPAFHLVIPFAAAAGDGWAEAMKSLPPGALRNLGKLLHGMKLVQTDAGDVQSLSPPHERVTAATLGLSAADGLLAWAAWHRYQQQVGTAGKAWAFITPCHWAMGREHATMADPAVLKLTAEESQILLAAMQPYFETEGITLHYESPTRWLAEGEVLRTLPTASLDRVLGRNVEAWLPTTSTAPSMRRLQNEMQMLLYTHAINDERGMKRQLPVNSIWLSATGALPADFQATAGPAATTARGLAEAAFADDWQAYSQAWSALDGTELAALLARQSAGEKVRLSLCGERNAHTFESSPAGLAARISGLFKSQRPLDVLEQL